MKQVLLLASLFFYHAVRNKQSFLELNHLSSAQKTQSKPQTNVQCYLQLKLYGKQQTVNLVTLDRQTALTVWHLHMNGNTE